MALTSATFTVTNRTSSDIAFNGLKLAPGASGNVNHMTRALALAQDAGYVTIVTSNKALTDLSLSTFDYSLLASYATRDGMVNNGTTFSTGELRQNFALLAQRIEAIENLVKTDIQNRLIPAR